MRATRPVRRVLAAALWVSMAVVLVGGDASAAGSGDWDHLGDGGTPGTASLNGTVSALHAAAPGALYVGGNFTSAGGNPAAARIARWDGSAWSAVGSPALDNGIVRAIAVAAGKVYVGGTFVNAGGNAAADYLAVWDGVSWQPFCGSYGGEVNALQVIGSTLYVGGNFQNGAGLASADYLVACDLTTGVASSTVDTDGDFTGGIDGLARDAAGTLYVAGGFINLDHIVEADNVAAYDGAWHALGSGPLPAGGAVTGRVRSIASNGADVFIGTDAVDVAGIVQADHVARWNGSTWSALGANAAGTGGWLPASTFINAITLAGSSVIVAGSFQDADGNAMADNVAGFDGSTWTALGSDGAGNGPWIGSGLALAFFGSQVVAGGSFTSAGGDLQARSVARYVPAFAPVPDPPPPPTSPPSPPAPVAAPTVTISSPGANTFFNRPEQILVSGKVTAPGGLASFCVLANSTGAPAPGICSQISQVQPDGTFTAVAMDGYADPGPNVITVHAVDNSGRHGQASVAIELPDGLDLRARSMEVTQGIQPFGLPVNLNAPVTYSGVRLVQGATTVVRVYANAFATGRAAGLPIPNVPALLEGTRNGSALPGSPLSPDSGPASLAAGPLPVGLRDVADPDSGYTFTLPLSWTSAAPVQLRATVNPQGNASSVPEANMTNNRFTLTGVGFLHRNPVLISPIRIIYREPGTTTMRIPGDPVEVFDATSNLTPLGDGHLIVSPYRGEIDVSALFASTEGKPGSSNARFNGIFSAVSDWEAGHNEDGLTIGVITGHSDWDARGREAPTPFAGCYVGCAKVSGPRIEPLAYVNAERPISSVTHEFWHMFNYWHAGHRCPFRSTDFPFVHWAPDDQGFMQGMGLDRHPGSGGRPGTYRRLVPGSLTDPPLAGQKPEYYDAMSYCNNGDDAATWVSPRTWDSFGDAFPLGLPNPAINHRRRGVRAETGRTLRVAAAVNPDGSAEITHLRPGSAGAISASDETSPYRVVVRDGAGNVVSSTGVKPELTHVDYTPGQIGSALVADVPADGAQTVEVTTDGRVVAGRTRSARPPTVQLLSPKPGGRIGSTGNVAVRWRAADADGDPLEVSLGFSTDGGRTLRTLAAGSLPGKAAVPATLFARTTNGRIRVEVSDGFDVVSALSGRLRAAGAAPVVRILKPARAQRVRADATLALLGQAFDESGRTIRSAKRLTWFDGRRQVGRGPSATLAGMTAGTHRLSLRARGANGRTGGTTVTVKVLGVRPDLMITAPASIGKRARSVKLKVAATVPGVLRTAGRSFPVGRTARTITIRVKPGATPLALRLSVRGGGGRASYVVRVRRG